MEFEPETIEFTDQFGRKSVAILGVCMRETHNHVFVKRKDVKGQPGGRSGAQPGFAGRAPNGRGLGRSQPLDILEPSVRFWLLGQGVLPAQAASRRGRGLG